MTLPTMATAPALDQITTRWSQICDPLRFVMRYSQAIRAYLAAIFRDEEAAEEASFWGEDWKPLCRTGGDFGTI
jgi:hypothetical protein